MKAMKFVLHTLAVSSLLLVHTALAQVSPTSFVSKLGMEIDVRSGGRVLEDNLAASHVILPDLPSPVAGVPAVPQSIFAAGICK